MAEGPHECRKYMTPIVYKGREMMGYMASCRNSRCNYIKTFANPESREEGIRRHRNLMKAKAAADKK